MTSARRRPAFTLVEVLAAMALLAIVLPVVMRGMSISLAAAESARHRSEAATLGEAKLNELVAAGGTSTTGASGDFGPDWPGYQWSCQTNSRSATLMEVVLVVTWQERGQPRSINLSTMVAG